MSRKNDEATQKLILLAEKLGLDEADLDDEVHNVAGSARAASYNSGGNDEAMGLTASGDDKEDLDSWDGAYSEMASDVNNEGLDGQIAFLVEHLGYDRTEALLKRLA